MDEKIIQKIDEQNKKIDDLVRVVNKMRRYFLIIVWVTVILFVLPLIAAVFIIPAFLNSYVGALNGLI